MNTNYLCKHTELEEKYTAFLANWKTKLVRLGIALLRAADELSFQI